MPPEIELKLAIDPRDVATLRGCPILKQLSLKHSGSRRFVGTYYDSPSFSLLRNGIVLRVRKIGRLRLQSIKMDAARRAGLTQRIELESPIRRDRPDLAQIAEPEIRRRIQRCCNRKRLVSIFVTNVSREIWLIKFRRSKVECAIDRGVIEVEAKRLPLCEVELELKSGQVEHLFQLARRLNGVVPLRIQTESKAARGYHLARDEKPIAPKAGSIDVNPIMRVNECFAAIAHPCLEHILASANFACQSEDLESIHQLRVAIRRMRAALSVFRVAMPEKSRLRLSDELRKLQQNFGAAREWDVLIEETLASMPEGLRKQRSTQQLIRIAQSKRTEGRESVRATLQNREDTETLIRLASWINSQFGSSPTRAGQWKPGALARPAPRLAAEVMNIYHHKVRKLGRRIDKLDAVKLHRLRIRIKKLRYAAEFFGGLWPRRQTKHYLTALKGLQQALGILHDATVADGLFARLAAAGRADSKLNTAAVNRWLVKYRRRRHLEVISLWGNFAKRRPFWKGI